MRTWSFLKLGLITAVLSACGGAGDDGVSSDESDLQEIVTEGSVEALAILALVNDRAVDMAELDVDARLDKRAAQAIITHRDGADGAQRTDDDDLYETVAELDDQKFVANAAFKQLLAYATKQGYLADQENKELSVIFSPQPSAQSHNAKIAEIIGQAEQSIDIAMYSFSDTGIQNALAEAAARGVRIRFIFDTGSIQKSGDLTASKAGKIEQLGADIRYVNKIMHHKWMVMDGARDDAGRAKTATIVTGSGNWSFGAASIYDENTLFLKGYPELALRLQGEFDYMWEHSRAFEAVPMGYELSTLEVTEEIIPDNPGLDALFTSRNFKVKDTTFSITGASHVSDALVDAILSAEDRIYVASGHLRSRPISEALIEKRAQNPDIEIKVYLDGQEYISDSYHAEQLADLDVCLAAATTESQTNKCMLKGFLFGFQLGESGVDVRYKYYAYRWDFSYAAQMHNKFLLIDDALYTGSYNLSDNAEQNTFENMLVFAGPEFRGLRDTYEDHFLTLWDTGAGLLPGLQAQVQSGETFPIVFPAMALTWTEIDALKSLIFQSCPQINSDEYRKNAAKHKVCEK
jgi:phosphatidylserine/phosphatidylglycerophosphate/cardiolipin synthase-like enzyme